MLRDWNMDKVHEVGWCIAFCFEGNPKSQQILMVPCMFPHASLYGLLRSCLTRVAASVILCACCAVRCEGEVSERIPSIQYLGKWEDESRYCQRCEPSNATAQGSTEASQDFLSPSERES